VTRTAEVGTTTGQARPEVESRSQGPVAKESVDSGGRKREHNHDDAVDPRIVQETPKRGGRQDRCERADEHERRHRLLARLSRRLRLVAKRREDCARTVQDDGRSPPPLTLAGAQGRGCRGAHDLRLLPQLVASGAANVSAVRRLRYLAVVVVAVATTSGCIEWEKTGRGGYQRGYDECLGKPIRRLARELNVPIRPQPVADAIADKYGGRPEERAETRRGCLAGLRDAQGF
jgi:hypothetical protein